MNNQIRKITIGTSYKEGMHYEVGQDVYGGHTISDIIKTEEGYDIYITRNGEEKHWKHFNNSVGISTETDLEY